MKKTNNVALFCKKKAQSEKKNVLSFDVDMFIENDHILNIYPRKCANNKVLFYSFWWLNIRQTGEIDGLASNVSISLSQISQQSHLLWCAECINE